MPVRSRISGAQTAIGSAQDGGLEARDFFPVPRLSYVGNTDRGRVVIVFESAEPPTFTAPGLTVPAEIR